MPKTMMTIMMMMMMIMTDPFTTNLVVKGPVVKGSVVKGAHPIITILVIRHVRSKMVGLSPNKENWPLLGRLASKQYDGGL